MRRQGGVALAILGLALLAGPGPAAGHDWYSGLVSPTVRSGGQPASCCNLVDCGPAAPCTLPDGSLGLTVRAACRPIPWHNVLPLPSPAGQAHACMYGQDKEPRCVILGGDA